MTRYQKQDIGTRNRVEINDESKGAKNDDNIKFKTSIARSNLGEYGGAYIHVRVTITVPNIAAVDAAKNKERIKKLKKQEIQDIFIKMN